jgi:hypothetical protein
MAGEHVTAICEIKQISLPTVKRAMAWFSKQGYELTVTERVGLAIAEKRWLRKKAVTRLVKLQEGDTVSSNEIGLLKIIRELDTDINNLRGLIRTISPDIDRESIEEVDISIKGVEMKGYYRVQQKDE